MKWSRNDLRLNSFISRFTRRYPSRLDSPCPRPARSILGFAQSDMEDKINMNPMTRIFVVLLSVFVASIASAADYPAPIEGDFTIRDFKFQSGETLPELRIHYRTLGELEKDAQGKTTNAVLIMHGTTGSGAQFVPR